MPSTTSHTPTLNQLLQTSPNSPQQPCVKLTDTQAETGPPMSQPGPPQPHPSMWPRGPHPQQGMSRPGPPQGYPHPRPDGDPYTQNRTEVSAAGESSHMGPPDENFQENNENSQDYNMSSDRGQDGSRMYSNAMRSSPSPSAGSQGSRSTTPASLPGAPSGSPVPPRPLSRQSPQQHNMNFNNEMPNHPNYPHHPNQMYPNPQHNFAYPGQGYMGRMPMGQPYPGMMQNRYPGYGGNMWPPHDGPSYGSQHLNNMAGMQNQVAMHGHMRPGQPGMQPMMRMPPNMHGGMSGNMGPNTMPSNMGPNSMPGSMGPNMPVSMSSNMAQNAMPGNMGPNMGGHMGQNAMPMGPGNQMGPGTASPSVKTETHNQNDQNNDGHADSYPPYSQPPGGMENSPSSNDDASSQSSAATVPPEPNMMGYMNNDMMNMNHETNSSQSVMSDESIDNRPTSKKAKTPKSGPIDVSALFEMGNEPDRRAFVERYLAFMEERGTPLTSLPVISKTPIDLYRLYRTVSERGGVIEVTRQKKWKDVSTIINVGASASAAYTCRKNYVKFLLPMECRDRGGLDVNQMTSQLEAMNTRKDSRRSRVPSPATQDAFRPPTGPPNFAPGPDGYPHSDMFQGMPGQPMSAPGHMPGHGPMSGPHMAGPPHMAGNQMPPMSGPGNHMPPMSGPGNHMPPMTGPPMSGPPMSGPMSGPPMSAPPSHIPPPNVSVGQPNENITCQDPFDDTGSKPPFNPRFDQSTPPSQEYWNQSGNNGYQESPVKIEDCNSNSQDSSDSKDVPPSDQSSNSGPGYFGNLGGKDGSQSRVDTPNDTSSPKLGAMSPPPSVPRSQAAGSPMFARSSSTPDSSGGAPVQEHGSPQVPKLEQPPPPPVSSYSQHLPSMEPSNADSSWMMNQSRPAMMTSAGPPPMPGAPGQQPMPTQPMYRPPMPYSQPNKMGPVPGPMQSSPLKTMSMPMNSGAVPRRDQQFSQDSIEALQPYQYKHRKLVAKDYAPLEAWRLMLALKSGLMAETTWALDALNVLLHDDTTVTYFSLKNLPGLLEVLIDYFRQSIHVMFGDIGDIVDPSTRSDDSVEAEDSKESLKQEEDGMPQLSTQNEDYSWVTRQGKPVVVDPESLNSEILIEACKWTTDTAKSCHIRTHTELPPQHLRQQSNFDCDTTDHIINVVESSETEDRQKCDYFGSGTNSASESANRCECRCLAKDWPYADIPHPREVALQHLENYDHKKKIVNGLHQGCASKSKSSSSSQSSSSSVKCEESPSENSTSETDSEDKRKTKRPWSSTYIYKDDDLCHDSLPCCQLNICSKRLKTDYDKEAVRYDEPPFRLLGDAKSELTKRCLCISNIIRSLSFVPGNDTEMSRSDVLLCILGRLLLFRHQHDVRSETVRSFEREELDLQDIPLTNEDQWWFVPLQTIRENVLVIVANISGKLSLSQRAETISLPLLDGLMHWAVCPSSEAQDPFSCHSTTSIISPQRLALEALCKLCISKDNVDLIIATPPYSRLATLVSTLVKFLSDKDQVLKEFAVVIFSYLVQGDPVAARTIALQEPSVSLLVDFVETAEQNALQVANEHGVNMLRENPETMGTSLDMLRRAATTLASIARVPENRSLVVKNEQRLLSLVMSQILDQHVAQTVSEVLFLCTNNTV